MSDVVREFLERYRPRPLYVSVSGGKDSAAVWAIVHEATRDYVAVYIQIAGNTHWDNIAAVYGVAKRLGVPAVRAVARGREVRRALAEALRQCKPPCLLHVLATDKKGGDFWAAVERYGVPVAAEWFGRGVRWCCAEFKHRVLHSLPPNCRGDWVCHVVGVKRADSDYRERRYTGHIMEWPRQRVAAALPLLDMGDGEVWDLLKKYGLYDVVRPQYDKWGRSPNCIFCPLLGKRKIYLTAAAAPPELKRHIVERLSRVRHRPGTVSAEIVETWVKALTAKTLDVWTV